MNLWEQITSNLAFVGVSILIIAALALLARLLRRMESALGWAVLSGAFGLCFGALCALTYLVAVGWSYALSWWISGIPFDLAHCAGNFGMALVLFRPCRKVLARLAGNLARP